MPLPPKYLYSIVEAAARWGCSVADVAGYAATGHLRIATGVRPLQCGGEVVTGLVEVAMQETLPALRRAGATKPIQIYRVRPFGEDEGTPVAQWHLISQPIEGLSVAVEDLCVPGADVAAFEAEFEIFGKPRLPGSGTKPKYDWEAFWQYLSVRLYREGLPDTQEELVREAQDWFMRRSDDGDAPDGRTLRRRITPLWYELRE